MIRRLRLGTLTLAVLFTALSAAAQPVDDATRSAARSLGYEGVSAYQKGDFLAANEKLDRAYRVLQMPSLGLWSARALVRIGKPVEASERYREIARLAVSGGDVAVQKKAQADAATELEVLAPKVPALTVLVEGAEAREVTLTIDGAPSTSELIGVPRPLNPGSHQIQGDARGQRAQIVVTLAEGEKKSVLLRFLTAAPAAPPPAPVPAPVPPVAAPTPAPPPAAPAPPPEPAHSPPPAAAPPAATPAYGAPSDPTAERSSGSGTATLGWVTVAIGGVGLAVGTTAFIIASGKKDDIDASESCRKDKCLASEQDLVDGYNTMRTLSTVGFIAGGALAATGIVLVLAAPGSSEPAAALYLSPTSSGVRGTF